MLSLRFSGIFLSPQGAVRRNTIVSTNKIVNLNNAVIAIEDGPGSNYIAALR